MGFRVIDTHGGLKTSYLAQASEVTITTTGNIDNLDFSNASTIRMNNASLSTIRGLKAGIAGQRVVIVSVGAGQVDLAHQNAGSTAANRLINFATSANSSLAAGVGAAIYEYDGTTLRWRLVNHAQGDWIAPAFAAGNFTASGSMTWTVDSGDVLTYQYWLNQRDLTVILTLALTSVSGVLNNALITAIPGGFTLAKESVTVMRYSDNGTVGLGLLDAFGSGIQAVKTDLSNWSASTNNTNVVGQLVLPVT